MKKREQIPEYLLRLMVLRILDSQYPDTIAYNSLEELMKTKVNCPSSQLQRIVAYLNEKDYLRLEGIGSDFFGRGEYRDIVPDWFLVKIKAEGIDYLESLEKDLRFEVENKEKEIGFKSYSEREEKGKRTNG